MLQSEAYPYYGTSLDNKDHLGYATAHRLSSLATGAGLVAGQLALRLVHDHILRLDVQRYRTVLSQSVFKINQRLKQVTRVCLYDMIVFVYIVVYVVVVRYSSNVIVLLQDGSAEDLSARWLIMALGSYSRAATDLNTELLNTDLTDTLACHNINDRIMRVRHTNPCHLNRSRPYGSRFIVNTSQSVVVLS